MKISFMNLDVISAGEWADAQGPLRDDLERLQAAVNVAFSVAHNVDGTQKDSSFGTNGLIRGTLAEQPTALDAGNDGLLFYVSDFGHVVRWDGSASVWAFAPGDNGSGYFQDFAITPQAPGWALANGSTVTYLVVGGAALATASITLPNLTGTPAYRKAAAAYTGTINAASGSLSGSTAGQSNDHTHGVTGSTSGPSALVTIREKDPPDFTESIPSATHHHDISLTSGGTSADHTHGAGSLAIASIDPANLAVLPFFRR